MSAPDSIPSFPPHQLDRAARDDSLTGKLGVTAGLQQRFGGDPVSARGAAILQRENTLRRSATPEQLGGQTPLKAALGELATTEATLGIPPQGNQQGPQPGHDPRQQ